MRREKYNLIQELQKKNEELKGKKRLALSGQGDFGGSNNIMRGTMNNKHKTQHLAIDKPEFPFLYDGKENVCGENSSYYNKTGKTWQVVEICKRYNELLKGKTYLALYFLYCREDDSYTVVERKEVENLTESFGFEYKNDYIDSLEVGDVIPKGTLLNPSTSYDEYGNTSIGVNGRILYGIDPHVQDDAIVISESFAKRVVTNHVHTIPIQLGENSVLLNLYGKDGEYQGLPNIGDVIDENNGIVCVTRNVKEQRMFSDMRDEALRNMNAQSDQIYYGKGEIIDINIYCNNKDLKLKKSNKMLVQYHTDLKWFYTKVYKIANKITKSGAKHISGEVKRWKRNAMNYLDTQAYWASNDNIVSNINIEILIRYKEPIKVGRKIVGRHGIMVKYVSVLAHVKLC